MLPDSEDAAAIGTKRSRNQSLSVAAGDSLTDGVGRGEARVDDTGFGGDLQAGEITPLALRGSTKEHEEARRFRAQPFVVIDDRDEASSHQSLPVNRRRGET